MHGGVKPIPHDEGSDILLNSIFKYCQKNHMVPDLELCRITPALRDRLIHVVRTEHIVNETRLYDETATAPTQAEALQGR